MRKLIIAFTMAFISAAGSASAASNADVTQHASGFMEWLFEVQFTAEQRERYQDMLEAALNSSDQTAVDGVVMMARIHEKLPELSESQRAAVRSQTKGEFMRLLQASEDADSQWLLSILTPSAPVTAAAAPAARPVASALLGRRSDGRIAMIQYQDAHTGASAPTNGRSFMYEFRADGTYSFTGLMQSVMYQCTTTMFSNETGRYFVEGNAVRLKPEKNPYRTTNNCSPSSKREGPGRLVERSYQFRVMNGEPAATLEFVGGDGAVMRFARSE